MTGICVICKLAKLTLQYICLEDVHICDRNSWRVPADTNFQQAIKCAIDFGFCESNPYYWKTGVGAPESKIIIPTPDPLKSLTMNQFTYISSYITIYLSNLYGKLFVRLYY